MDVWQFADPPQPKIQRKEPPLICIRFYDDFFIFDNLTSEQAKVLRLGACPIGERISGWGTSNFRLAYRAMKMLPIKNIYIEDTAREAWNRAFEEEKKWEKLSAATDTNIPLKFPAGLELRGYQRAGAAWILSHRGSLIADDPGLGKTIEVLVAINTMDKIQGKILIICPASVKENWRQEWNKWTTHKELSVGICESINFPNTDVIIINYDLVIRPENWKKIEALVPFGILVVDESHMLKNSDTKRSQHIVGKMVRKDSEWVREGGILSYWKMFLTGSPFPNRVKELWPQLQALDPKTFKNFFSFGVRFCGGSKGRYGWNFNGSTDAEGLNKLLRRTVMIRRLKSEVLTELPPKSYQTILLPTNGEDIAAKERELLKSHGIEATGEDLYNLILKGSPKFELIARMRHDVGTAKIPYLIDHLESLIEQGVKVVCFVWHKDVVEALEKAFPFLSVTIDGSTPSDRRQMIVNTFQEDPKVMLFIGTSASYEGITLTASSNVVVGEPDWVPGRMRQAEDRTHRIGQSNSVLVQYLAFENTLDEYIIRTFLAKEEYQKVALGTPKEREKPKPPRASEPRGFVEGLKDLVSKIHEGIKRLAGVCDGAIDEDNQGFNKFDAEIGHSFAKQESLTTKQAVVAAKLVKKYRRQLPTDIVEAAEAFKEKTKGGEADKQIISN